MNKRILILTASMGEGHNTAARNIRQGLLEEGVLEENVLVADPYTRTNPVVNKLMQGGYSVAINRAPRAWKMLFDLLGKRGVVESMRPMLAQLQAGVESLVEEFRPDIVVSTYPIFSFLVENITRKHPMPPLYTLITDSTFINASWYRHACTGFLVLDESSREALLRGGVASEKIHVLGFPVSGVFDVLDPVAQPPAVGEPWRILFYPCGGIRAALAMLERLAAIPNTYITVLAGRRKPFIKALQSARLPHNGEVLGWSDQMPQLMASHHIFVGKAGGATVQEAIAARLPFVVSFLVPGQEEGNISLIERNGFGVLAASRTERPGDVVEGAIANDARLWRAWKDNVTSIYRPGASRAIARFVLERLTISNTTV